MTVRQTKKIQENGFRPDLSVRYAPRINRKFAEMAAAVAKRENMRKGDVLQYCFEAAVAAGGGEGRSKNYELRSGNSDLALDAMLTVRTSRKVQGWVRDIWMATPNALEADVLRGLLEWGLTAALSKRISYVVKLREAIL